MKIPIFTIFALVICLSGCVSLNRDIIIESSGSVIVRDEFSGTRRAMLDKFALGEVDPDSWLKWCELNNSKLKSQARKLTHNVKDVKVTASEVDGICRLVVDYSFQSMTKMNIPIMSHEGFHYYTSSKDGVHKYNMSESLQITNNGSRVIMKMVDNQKPIVIDDLIVWLVRGGAEEGEGAKDASNYRSPAKGSVSKCNVKVGDAPAITIAKYDWPVIHDIFLNFDKEDIRRTRLISDLKKLKKKGVATIHWLDLCKLSPGFDIRSDYAKGVSIVK